MRRIKSRAADFVDLPAKGSRNAQKRRHAEMQPSNALINNVN